MTITTPAICIESRPLHVSRCPRLTRMCIRIDPSIRLRRAILLNDVLLVQRIIRNHPGLLLNPDFQDKSNTSLHLAAAHGYTDIASLLIHAGHDAHEISRNAEHETPLMLAAQHGHVECGTLLATHFAAHVGGADARGRDALARAAQHPGATNLIPVLLGAGASPHAADGEGNTPLHHASASGSLKALRILLAAGANPLAKNHHDWTPLAYSQTVAAEVYFRNLVAEFERRKAEGVKQSEERERARAAGVRLVDEQTDALGRTISGEGNEEEALIGDALKRHWSPVERKRPNTPGGSGGVRHEWGSPLTHFRTRSGSVD